MWKAELQRTRGFHLLVHLLNAKFTTMARARLHRRQEHHPDLPRGWRGPSTRAIFHCSPRHISRQVDWKWSSSDLSWSPCDASTAGSGVTCQYHSTSTNRSNYNNSKWGRHTLICNSSSLCHVSEALACILAALLPIQLLSMSLGKCRCWLKYVWSLSPMWEPKVEFWPQPGPALSIVIIWGVSESVNGRSHSLTVIVPFK